MDYRALVMDIDGTLLCRERPQPSAACAAALAGLQRRGVVVIAATGRAPHACTPRVLGGFAPNYRVCVNGACIVDAAGRVLHEDVLDEAAVTALADYTCRGERGVCFSFEDGYYAYSGYERYNARYRAGADDPHYVHDGRDRTRHLRGLPYAAFALMPPQDAEVFCALYPDIRLVRVADGAYDVCKAGNHKAKGLALLLKRLGIGWGEVVAVGDGDNDLEMLALAGAGVAMANAPAHVKAAAGHLTDSVQADGVLRVVREFFGG